MADSSTISHMSKKKRSAIRNENSKTKQGGATKDTSIRVHQRDKIDWLLEIRERDDLTDKQKVLKELILDKETKVVFISGPAGTSKTWLAVYCGLHLLQQRRISNLVFVRTIIESASKSLGSLPGEMESKMQPFMMPLMDKLEELLPTHDIKRLLAEERVHGLPINYLRGASMNAQYIILEEAQNFSLKELTTALTRIGKYSKVIVIGDPDQSDINGQSGFQPMFDLFNNEECKDHGIHALCFTKDDIVRSGILKFIVERIETYKMTHPVKH